MRISLVAIGALLAASPAPLTAQTDGRLLEVIRLTHDGFGDSARATVGRLLGATPRTDPLYPEVLYTVALVAARNDDRRLHLQRIVVEYAQSEWADDAILQLAQLDYAGDNPAGTVQHVTRLLTDYPMSPLAAQAALWGARAAYEQRNPLLACQWAARGLAAVGDAVELKAQLEFQQQRCQAALARPAEAPGRAAPPPAPGPPPPPPAPARRGPVWRVQVAALTTQDAVNAATAALRELGLETTVVREGGFLKVRAGAFPSRAAAQAEVARIRARLGGQPFVVSEP